jgi:oligosaccharide repeat unit polymerase
MVSTSIDPYYQSTQIDPGTSEQPAEAPIGFFALIGVASSLVGTVLALLWFPLDPTPAGALFLPALLQALGLLTVPVLMFIKERRLIFRIENIVMFGLVYWLLIDMLQSAYDMENVSADAIYEAFAMIGLFASGVWCSILLKPASHNSLLSRVADFDITPTLVLWFSIICFVLGMAYPVYCANFDISYMISGLLRARSDTPWARGDLGGWDAFGDQLNYFGYNLPAMLSISILLRGWADRGTALIFILTIIEVLFLAQTGSRRYVGGIIFSGVTIWLIASPNLDWRRLVTSGLILGLVLFLLQIMLKYRKIGFGELLETGDISAPRRYLHVDDNILRLSQLIDLYPKRKPYPGWDVPFYFFARPIPRVFWPEKPINPGYDLAATLGYGKMGLTASVISDWYLMGGWPFVLLGGMIYGRICAAINQFLYHKNEISSALIFSLSAIAVFVSLRALIEILLMSYVLLSFLALVAAYKAICRVGVMHQVGDRPQAK